MTQTVHLDRDAYEFLLRKHVRSPQNWGVEAGTDFWLIVNANGGLGSGNAHELADYGWTTTSLALADGSAADFMSSSDVGTPPQITQNAQNDLLKSPAIFGDYTHARQAMLLLGKKTLPRYLIADMYATFSVASGNETTTALGFVEDGGSIVTANDHAAAIVSTGTYWTFRSGGDTVTSTTAVDTNPHRFRIVLDRTISGGTDACTAYVDGTSIGTIDLETDEFPVAFGAGSGGATNFVQLHQARVFYAYKVPQEV